MTYQSDAQIVDYVYGFADALKAANDALAGIPVGKRAALDALLDTSVYPGDLDLLAKKLNAVADEWQSEIEERDGDAAEAEDRCRANPLEPDFRRLGQ